MAQRLIPYLVDDLTGERGDVARHHVALDGRVYEVDLAPDTYAQLALLLRPYLQAGRRVTTAPGAWTAAPPAESFPVSSTT
ncbi:Lsr2 dimerization domain-containing protein [Streptomyces sp. NBC_01304]|uniref:Lsr2 dimerization domain-containing protein n=1 Tax=Streptomyces sp. NBC_01304 TaxID=2903818 RepID=UPI002E0E38F2|nr:Lsr2 family protein [Streptomyces sp. NBC_01304]